MKRAAIVLDELPPSLRETAHQVTCPACGHERLCYSQHLYSTCRPMCGNCRRRDRE